MSILAYVLCVLLVATATTATDDVFDAEISINMFVGVTKAVKQRYESASKMVDKVLLQMKLEMPLEMDTWPSMGKTPSAKCYEFLRKSIETHKSLVAECSQSGFEAINFERERLEKLLKPLLKRFDEHKRFAELCVSLYRGDDDEASRTALCIAEVREDITAMSERADEEIEAIVRYVRKVANTWVTETGLCLVYDEGGNAAADWYKACQET